VAAFTKDGGRAFDAEARPGQTLNASAVVKAVVADKADGVFLATNDINAGAGAPRRAATVPPYAAPRAPAGSRPSPSRMFPLPLPTPPTDVIQALRKLPTPVQIFLGDSLMDATLAARAGPAAVAGVRGSDVAFGSPEFISAFGKFTAGTGIEYTPKAARAYDATTALLTAFAAAAPPKGGPEILEQLQKVRFQGVSGPVAFDEAGDLEVAPGAQLYDVIEFDKRGAVVKSAAAPAAAAAGAGAGAAPAAGAAGVPAAAGAAAAPVVAAPVVTAPAAAAAVPPATAAAPGAAAALPAAAAATAPAGAALPAAAAGAAAPAALPAAGGMAMPKAAPKAPPAAAAPASDAAAAEVPQPLLPSAVPKAAPQVALTAAAPPAAAPAAAAAAAEAPRPLLPSAVPKPLVPSAGAPADAGGVPPAGATVSAPAGRRRLW
jgi:hypothetical protein